MSLDLFCSEVTVVKVSFNKNDKASRANYGNKLMEKQYN